MFTDGMISDASLVDCTSDGAAATRPVVDDLPAAFVPPASPPPVVVLADCGRERGVLADGCGGRDEVLAVGGGLGADWGRLRGLLVGLVEDAFDFVAGAGSCCLLGDGGMLDLVD